MKRRIYSMMLALIMLISTVSMVSAETVVTPGASSGGGGGGGRTYEVTLADYTKMEDIIASGYEPDTENKLFGDVSATFGKAKLEFKDNNGKYSVAGNRIIMGQESGLPTNWTPYTHINLWVYSDEAVDTKFAIAVRSEGIEAAKDEKGNILYDEAGNYVPVTETNDKGETVYKKVIRPASYMVSRNFKGWKKISVPLRRFNVNSSYVEFSWANIADTYVSLTYSNDLRDEYAAIYDAGEYKKLSIAKMWLSKEESAIFTVMDDSNWNSMIKEPYTSVNTTEVRKGTKSLKVYTTEEQQANWSASRDSFEGKRYTFSAAQDWSDYQYINLWMKNTNTVTTGEGDSAVTAPETTKFRFVACLQGTEAAAKIGYWYKDFVTADGTGWELVSIPLSTFKQGLNTSSSGITPVAGDKYSEMNHITGIFFDHIYGSCFIDEIWLSNEIPTQNYTSVYNTDSSSPTKDYIKYRNKDTDNDKVSDFVVSNIVTNEVCINDKALVIYGLAEQNTYETSSASLLNAPQDWSHYDSIKFRVKNGNADGTPSVFTFYGSINGNDCSAKSGLWSLKVTVSGTQWQTITLPMSSFKLSKNNDNGDIEDAKYKSMCNIEGIRFNKIKGTIYIEDISLANDVVLAATVSEGAEISAYTREVELTALCNIDKDWTASKIKLHNNTKDVDVDVVTAVEGNKIKVLIPDALDVASSYTLSLKDTVYDIHEQTYDADFAVNFTTEDFSVEKSNSFVSAKMVCDDAAKALIIASYDVNGALIDVATKSLGADETVIANEYVQKGAINKVFVWNNSNIEPLSDVQ